jgi:hypothetical protein
MTWRWVQDRLVGAAGASRLCHRVVDLQDQFFSSERSVPLDVAPLHDREGLHDVVHIIPLLFLAAVVALSCGLAVVLGSHGALAQTSNTATPGRSCTVVQQASVGLDLNLPIGKSITRDRCDLATDSASVTAAWLTAAGWVLQLLAWAFAALFIAGFTSAVRKT